MGPNSILIKVKLKLKAQCVDVDMWGHHYQYKCHTQKARGMTPPQSLLHEFLEFLYPF